MSHLIIAATALFALGCGRPLQAQAGLEMDAQHVFRAKGEVNYAILQVAREAHRPVGVVGNTWGEHCSAPVSVEAGDLRSALDMISAQCPAWSWHRIGGSVVFQLSRTVNAPLAVVVASYSVKQVPWSLALRQAMDLPEVRAWLSENDATASQEWLVSSIEQPGEHVEPKKEPLVSVTANGIRFAEVMDEIAGSAGYAVWYLRVERSGRRIVMSLR